MYCVSAMIGLGASHNRDVLQRPASREFLIECTAPLSSGFDPSPLSEFGRLKSNSWFSRALNRQ